MPLLFRLLGAGPTNAGTLTVPYSVSSPALGAIVNNLRFVNTGGSPVTVNLFFKPSGGSQIRIFDKDKSVAAGKLLIVKPEITMGQGDAIEVTTSAAIDFVVAGVERI